MARLIGILAIFGIVLMCVHANNDLYSDKYDNINIVALLENSKLRNQYRMCFEGSGPCKTAAQKYYKEIISEAILTNCKRCTEKQKENLDITAEWYMKHEPNNWNTLISRIIEEMKRKNNN